MLKSIKTAVSLFSPQNYLDILLNLHMDSVWKLICSIKNFLQKAA